MALDTAGLGRALLKRGMSQHVVDRIIEEEFTWQSLPKVTPEVLRAMGFKGNDIVEILSMKDTIESAMSDEEEEGSDGSSGVALEKEYDDVLLRYFSPSDVDELSVYDKESLVNQYQRWQMAIKSNLPKPDACKPKFVAQAEARNQKAQKVKRKLDTQKKDDGNYTLRSRGGREIPNAAQKLMGYSSKDSNNVAESSGKKRKTDNEKEDDENCSLMLGEGQENPCDAEPNERHESLSAAEPNERHESPSAAEPTERRESPSAAEHNESGVEHEASETTTEVNATSSACTASASKSDLPSFKVKEIVEVRLEGERGKTIMSMLNNGEKLSNPDRKLVIRIVTKWLYNKHVSDTKEVTSKMKEGLAKSLSVTWPGTFSFPSTNENVAPWAPLFDVHGNTGFIVNAARPIQKKSPSRKSKNATDMQQSTKQSPEFDNDAVDRLALIVPHQKATIKAEILRGMEKSFKMRQEERNKGQTITFFLQKYIHFTSYGGEVISEEFARMHPTAKRMASRFAQLQPKILGLRARRDIELELDSEVLLALVLLSHHLPHDIPMAHDKEVDRSWGKEEDLMTVVQSVGSLVEYMQMSSSNITKQIRVLEFYYFLQTKDNIDDYVVDRRSNATGPVQPYLILVRSDLDSKIIKIFLVLESKATELTCVNVDSNYAILQAFEILMQSFVVFNVCHPYGWRNTLHFVQHFVYGVQEHKSSRGKKSKASPTQTVLWTSLTKDLPDL